MSWAGLQWAVGKVGHREVRTLRQGGLEGWKESVSHLKSLGNMEEPGQVQEVFILQIKECIQEGKQDVFWRLASQLKRRQILENMAPVLRGLLCAFKFTPWVWVWHFLLDWSAPWWKEGNFSKRSFAPKEISVGKAQENNLRAYCS